MKKMTINDENNKNRNCLQSVSNDCHRILSSAMDFKEYILFEIIQHWKEFASEFISKNSLPNKITFKTENYTSGTLHIIVSSGIFATELDLNKNTLISKINSFFAKEVISDLKITQGFKIK